MKFNKSRRLALAIFFIYLTSFVELTQVQSALRLKLKSISENIIKEKDHVVANNPLINFLIGTLEGLGGNETGFYSCFPNDWKKPGKANDGQVNTLDNSFKSWGPGFQIFLNAGEHVINFLCKFRDQAMTLISGVVARNIKNKRKFRMMSFMETGGRSLKRSKRSRRMYTAYSRSLMYVSEKKVQWWWDNIRDQVFKSWFQPLSGGITNLVNSIVYFFKGPIFDKIKKVFDCIQSAKNAVNTVIKTIKSLKSKLDVLMKAVTSQVLLVILVTDYITAMICNWKKFKQAIDFLMAGLNSGDMKMKWLFFGKALGTLLYAISTSNTFDMNKYLDIQKNISNRKK